MRYWSPWDDQLLRALRSEFKAYAPILTFVPGREGGVAVLHEQTEIGLWIAASRHTYRYLPADGGPGTAVPCDIMDIIAINRELFSDLLSAATRGSAR
ncbi:MAG: hypothetical protein ACK4TL_17790 [Hyphomicrobiaceae bacterium]